ncbi:hypothetical protein BS50DRAFT_583520 [Corynespora cassiicola Philippines]|uniref:Uncharacterized protein n=1 Tax=Corynespora cassiicola Philippines TaxID=1448308 RepID=A0A2T2P3I4_CORCC|nr:hypothetical protein BS50DRAFT_583520 [Corynespora cassiicola Philippines]
MQPLLEPTTAPSPTGDSTGVTRSLRLVQSLRSRFSSQLLELNVTVPQQLWFHVSITTYPAMAEQGQKVTVGRGEGHVFGEKRTPNWDANNGRRMGKASFESLSGRAMVVLGVDAHQVANAKTQHAKAVIEAPAILVRHVTAANFAATPTGCLLLLRAVRYPSLWLECGLQPGSFIVKNGADGFIDSIECATLSAWLPWAGDPKGQSTRRFQPIANLSIPMLPCLPSRISKDYKVDPPQSQGNKQRRTVSEGQQATTVGQ